MLPFDLGANECLGESKASRLVVEGAILSHAALDLSGG